MKKQSSSVYIFFFFFVAVFSSCSTTRFLDEGELLLKEQNIKGNEKIPDSELEVFFRQTPNRTIPFSNFSPYAWFYQIGLYHYDREAIQNERNKIEAEYNRRIEEEEKVRKKKRLQRRKNRKISKKDKLLNEGNFWMRQGEPLAVFDETLVEETVSQMNAFLHTKGFFTNEVDYDLKIRKKRVTVDYEINEGQPYLIDTIIYKTENPVISGHIRENWDQRILVEGEVYDQEKFTAERNRIDEMLKNRGFYDFSKQYIEYNVDTATLDNRKVSVELVINRPAGRGYHKVYKIDSVIFTTDASIRTPKTGKRKTSTYNGVTYKYFEEMFSKEVLDSKLKIYPKNLYSRSQTFETQRQLSYLDMFKFININYDTTGGKFIANIFTSPLKKYTTSNEIGMNVTQGFPGPFYNLGFKNRNPFGGLEILEINGRVGIEGVAGATSVDNVYQSQELGFNASLIFPRFIAPYGRKLTSRFGEINPRTRLLTGFNFNRRPEYLRSIFRSQVAYTWQDRRNTFYNFSPVDINIIYSSTSDEWQARLDDLQQRGNPLWVSFLPSFVSSMSFYSIFNFGQYGTQSKQASYLRVFGESGGTTLNFLPSDANILGLTTFQFVKLTSDYRYHTPINLLTKMAYRINVGVAVPYGANKTLPYEKFFFLGGSNSNRAWAPRRLGPGSYTPQRIESGGEQVKDTDERNYLRYQFEQPGEILLEGSIEFRRNLIGFLNGAWFVDVGNIWTIRQDEERPGANFEFNRFWRELAIGSGFGLRFDFSFLIARLDAGWKIYDPARPEGQRWIGQMFDIPTELRYTTFNIGIGYPF